MQGPEPLTALVVLIILSTAASPIHAVCIVRGFLLGQCDASVGCRMVKCKYRDRWAYYCLMFTWLRLLLTVLCPEPCF